MENRIDRKSDESLYQPKIHSERIKELYNLRQTTGKPMTVLVDQALRELAESYNSTNHLEGPQSGNVRETTWEELCEYRRLLDELDYAKCLRDFEKFKTNEQGRKTD
jgi:hypothetical protein